jgi:hypothetical protein
MSWPVARQSLGWAVPLRCRRNAGKGAVSLPARGRLLTILEAEHLKAGGVGQRRYLAPRAIFCAVSAVGQE